MAFATTVSRTTTASATSNSTTFAVNVPSDPASGHILLAWIVSDGGPTLTTTSTGWSKVGSQVNQGAVAGALFSATCDGSSRALTVNSSASEQFAAVVYEFSGTSVTFDSASFATTSGASGAVDPPNCNPGTARDYTWLALGGKDSSELFDGTEPTNYTNLQTNGNGGSNGCVAAGAERQLNASAENPVAFQGNGHDDEQFVAASVAVYLAAAADALLGQAIF